MAADAYSVANRLPNVMYAVLAAGVLNSALVPQIVKAFHGGSERTVHRILTLGGVGILVATTVLTLTAGIWVRVYSHCWGPEQTALATAFALWCIPQLLFYGLYTLFGQVLNAREQFGWFMWAPVANNVVAIAGLVAYLVLFGALRLRQESRTVAAIVDDVDHAQDPARSGGCHARHRRPGADSHSADDQGRLPLALGVAWPQGRAQRRGKGGLLGARRGARRAGRRVVFQQRRDRGHEGAQTTDP